MKRGEKPGWVASMREEVFLRAPMIAVVHYRGLTAGEMTGLRRRIREAGGNLRVTRNRLALRAIEGTRSAPLAPLFSGPSAVSWGDDPVAIARSVVDFGEKNPNLVVLGGLGEGDALLSAADMKFLATLPSLEALRAKLAGLIQAPAGKLVTLTAEPGSRIARLLALRTDGHTGTAGL